MKFLEDLGFNQEEITRLEESTPELILSAFKEGEELVSINVQFLKDLGITNYKDIVINYADMFLLDASNFEKLFSKYEKSDLIEKINNDFTIVEHL